MPSIQLFYWVDSCSLACHILLRESGLPFTATEITPTEEGFAILRKLNPKARVPTLTIDGQVITESQAIMLAIAQLAPQKQLLGKTDLEAVRVQEWLSWMVGAIHGQAWALLFRPGRFSDDGSTHEAVQAKGRATVIELYGMIEEKVHGKYAVGDGVTAADAFLYVLYRWAKKHGVLDKTVHPKFCEAMTEFQKRESVQKVLDVEHLSDIVA